jgi:mercuric ion binding protein
MKPIILCFFALSGLVSVGAAQIKASDKAVIKTPSIQCDKCRETIEFYISHEDGVTSVKVDLKKKTTTVTWLTDRTTLENIKVAIANLGYDADDIEAEEFAYKHLPKECKKPVEKPKPVVPKE